MKQTQAADDLTPILAAAGLLLGGGLLLLATKAGPVTCPPNSTPVPGVPGVCCPNGATYNPTYKQCFNPNTNPGGGGNYGNCPTCAPPNYCDGDACIHVDNGVCAQGCDVAYCLLGLCLPVTCGSDTCRPPYACTSDGCVLICNPPCPDGFYCNTTDCFNQYTTGCGSCFPASPTQATWSLSNITAAFPEISGGNLKCGNTVDAQIGCSYTGPGGSVVYGYDLTISLFGVTACTYTLTSAQSAYLPASDSPTSVTLNTTGLQFPCGCAPCFGVGAASLTIHPFVHPVPGGTLFYGNYQQAPFSC